MVQPTLPTVTVAPQHMHARFDPGHVFENSHGDKGQVLDGHDGVHRKSIDRQHIPALLACFMQCALTEGVYGKDCALPVLYTRGGCTHIVKQYKGSVGCGCTWHASTQPDPDLNRTPGPQALV